jgi:hypothetical protein
MKVFRLVLLSLLMWAALWAFWFTITRNYHPTTPLAIIVTTSLMAACAISIYVDHLVLIPRLWRHQRFAAYFGSLLAAVAVSTAILLAVIRTAYYRTLGPDPDPYGACRHFAIDFSGVLAHVAAAAAIVWLWKRMRVKVVAREG